MVGSYLLMVKKSLIQYIELIIPYEALKSQKANTLLNSNLNRQDILLLKKSLLLPAYYCLDLSEVLFLWYLKRINQNKIFSLFKRISLQSSRKSLRLATQTKPLCHHIKPPSKLNQSATHCQTLQRCPAMGIQLLPVGAAGAVHHSALRNRPWGSRSMPMEDAFTPCSYPSSHSESRRNLL